MANDIGDYFAAEPDQAQAVEGVTSHIRRFWDPRMRKQIIAYYQTGGEALKPLVKHAIARLAASA
ncbi:MAG: formate dehydrogenase subunit delta [Gammaproteobacteria bacterium]|nr:formate dehydrogenase subunit delta [Gammaproteobacteria bacterium]MBI5619209.1 formate dehydrogenase subunit delta [Gammaproteobacteria bacterium]